MSRKALGTELASPAFAPLLGVRAPWGGFTVRQKASSRIRKNLASLRGVRESLLEAAAGSFLGKNPHTRVLLALLLATGLPAVGWGKVHPPLVEPEKAKCGTCHGKLLEAKHPHLAGGEQCLRCHVFRQKEQLEVQLIAEQPQLCTSCHSQVAQQLSQPQSHPPAGESCTSCHAPHGSDNAALLTAPQPQLCNDCHDEASLKQGHKVSVARARCTRCHEPHGSSAARLLRTGSQHKPFAAGTCNACHRQGLGSRLLFRKQGAELCFACHTQEEKQWQQGSVHGAVKQGQCLGCHDPHLAARPKLLQDQSPALCYRCHEAIRAKLTAQHPHPPAVEDCSSCHAPHASPHPAQLTEAPQSLCASCHDLADQALEKKHLGKKLSGVDCLGCHDPHGSEQKALLASGSLHPPFAEGTCDACHEAGGKLAEGGGNALCGSCHGDLLEQASKAKVPHAALEAGGCTACHSPHAANRPALLRGHGAQPCAACHEEQTAKAGQHQHGVIESVGCHSCHEPHGGDQSRLLRASAEGLCLGCHTPTGVGASRQDGTVKLLGRYPYPAAKAQKLPLLRLSANGQRDHPVSGHRVLGTPSKEELARVETSFRETLHCLSCHDPHRSPGPFLAKMLPSGELVSCETCHRK